MPANSQTKKFLTVAEFAALTGDSESTVRREIRAGKLRYQQSGPRKKIKIPLDALEIRSSPTSEDKPTQCQKPNPALDVTETFSGPTPNWMN